MSVPAKPLIFHITHVDNLSSIANDGCLYSDAEMIKRQGQKVIGNSEIKLDRLNLPVHCHPGTKVGEYVPFYFCPRSVMLYVISKGNHQKVAFRGGQETVVHLCAYMHEVVEWARQNGQKWAFTSINAANRAADFYNDLASLDEVNWEAVNARQWVSCRDHKMAEFLLLRRFPWQLVRVIGVISEKIGRRAILGMKDQQHRPPVRVKPDWYY